MNTELIFALLNGCGAMALVAICFGQIERLKLGQTAQSLLQGLLFGTGAVVAMQASVEALPGFRVDARSIFVAFSAAFAGIPAAVVTMVITLVFRLAKGGDGVYAAMLALPVAASVGLLWRRLIGQRRARLPCLAALGAGTSLTLLLSPLFLTADQIIAMSGNMAMIIMTNIALAMILGSFIERERRHLRRETQLFAEARSDALTGLANRRSFERIANRKLAEAGPAHPVSLLAMDLDHFKDVNDRYGHAFGDEVLRAAAKLIEETVGADGLAARLGGEEFVAIVHLDETKARSLAMTIRQALENSGVLFGTTPVRVTLSIGVSILRKPSRFQDAFAGADMALYAAKRLGRNRVEYAATRREAA